MTHPYARLVKLKWCKAEVMCKRLLHKSSQCREKQQAYNKTT